MTRRILAVALLLAAAAQPQAPPADPAPPVPVPGMAVGIPAHGGPIRALAAGPAGLASGGLDQAIIFWSAAGQARTVSRWHRGAVEALVAMPGSGPNGGPDESSEGGAAGGVVRGAVDGPAGDAWGGASGVPGPGAAGGFVSAGDDGSIAIWPASGSTQPAATLEGHAGPVLSLAAGPGAIASGGFDGAVRVWVRQGAGQGAAQGPPSVLTGHQGAVTGLAFTSQGLVSAGRDGTLRLWPEGRLLAAFDAPIAALLALPGGFAAAGADGTIRLDDGRSLSTGPRPLVALAEHGGILAAASIGGDVGLWDWHAGRLLRVLQGPGLPVWSLAFAPDGSLWTGGADRQLRRWDVATGRPLAETAAAVVAIPAGADAAGARVFRACQACHALGEDASAMAGPTLHGLFGRRMGSVPGYGYSPRLAQGDIVWTAETVADLFTRGPDVVTPGTRMPVQRVGNPEELAALLRFLAIATQ